MAAGATLDLPLRNGKITSTGHASVDGAYLAVELTCDIARTLPAGTVYTLLDAAGGLSGRLFTARGDPIPNGGVIGLGPSGTQTCLLLRIGYSAHSVTATVIRPPTVETGAATAIVADAATLNGMVNPNGGEVSDCHFDYGRTADYGSTAPCATTVGQGISAVAVTAQLAELSPDTEYHFRLVASNAAGTGTGADAVFTTGHPAPPRGRHRARSDPAARRTSAPWTPTPAPCWAARRSSSTAPGSSPGTSLCFYASPIIKAAVACIADAQISFRDERFIDAKTPNLGNSAAVGEYYLGIERCCSFDAQANANVTSDYVSGTTYLYFPPPPLVQPSDCDIFSLGENACWRVGLGAIISGLFKPGRPPDYIVLSVGGSAGPISADLMATLTCSGDLWGSFGAAAGPSLQLPFTGDLRLPFTAVFANGYVGFPTDGPGTRTWEDVDGFISGLTGNVTIGDGTGVTVVFGAGRRWAAEWWVGANASIAVGFSFSQYLLGPDPYSLGPFPERLNTSVNPHCTSVYTTDLWQAIIQSFGGGAGVRNDSAALAVPCLSDAACTGSASLTSVGAGASAARAGRPLGTARFTIPAHAVRRVRVRLSPAARRLLAAAHGRLPARLTLDANVGSRHVHQAWTMPLELAPRLTRVRQSARKWRKARGTAFTFTVNEACQVGLTFTQPGASLGQVVIDAHRGRNIVRFHGAISGTTRLGPGSYTAHVVAANTAGQRSRFHRLPFRID